MKLESPQAPFDEIVSPRDANTFIWNTETSCFKYFKHKKEMEETWRNTFTFIMNFPAFVPRGSLTVLMTKLVVSCCPTAFSDSSWWSATWTTNNDDRFVAHDFPSHATVCTVSIVSRGKRITKLTKTRIIGSWKDFPLTPEKMSFSCIGFMVPLSIQIIIFKDMIWISTPPQKSFNFSKKLGGQHRFTATKKRCLNTDMATCLSWTMVSFQKLPALMPVWRQPGGTWSSRGEGLTCWTHKQLSGKIVALLKWSAASKPVRLEHYCARLMQWYDMGRYDQITHKLRNKTYKVTSNNNHALHHKASIATCRFLEYKELLDLINLPLLTGKINPHRCGKGMCFTSRGLWLQFPYCHQTV